MPAETPMLPLAPEANLAPPFLRTASIMNGIFALARKKNRFRESILYPVQMW